MEIFTHVEFLSTLHRALTEPSSIKAMTGLTVQRVPLKFFSWNGPLCRVNSGGNTDNRTSSCLLRASELSTCIAGSAGKRKFRKMAFRLGF